MTDNYQRIAVIGTSGSGKTTLARTLAQQLDLPHTELDAIHWGPDWTPTPPEIMMVRVAACICKNGQLDFVHKKGRSNWNGPLSRQNAGVTIFQ